MWDTLPGLDFWVYSLACLIGCIALIYLVLFWVFFSVCRMSGPLAIRWAWTAGMVLVYIYCINLSSMHAPYLGLWTGNTNTCLAFLVAVIIVLVLVWISMPSRSMLEESKKSI